jgi:hypothetical protein
LLSKFEKWQKCYRFTSFCGQCWNKKNAKQYGKQKYNSIHLLKLVLICIYLSSFPILFAKFYIQGSRETKPGTISRAPKNSMIKYTFYGCVPCIFHLSCCLYIFIFIFLTFNSAFTTHKSSHSTNQQQKNQ